MKADPERGRLGKLLSPARRRAYIDKVVAKHGVSKRFAYRAIGQLVGPVQPARRARHIRSDNGPEFIAKSVREWIVALGAKTAYI